MGTLFNVLLQFGGYIYLTFSRLKKSGLQEFLFNNFSVMTFDKSIQFYTNKIFKYAYKNVIIVKFNSEVQQKYVFTFKSETWL